jgi:integrase
VRGAKAAVISRTFDGISCRHAGEGVERLHRKRSSFCRSHAGRRAQRNGIIGAEEAFAGVPNLSQKGTRLGNWLTRDQAKELLTVPDRSKIKGKRDYVILALLLGCALRRQELASLDVDRIQMREGRWVLPDLRGK